MPWHLAEMPRAEIAEYLLDIVDRAEASEQ